MLSAKSKSSLAISCLGIVATLLIAATSYAVTSSWQNSERLSNLAASSAADMSALRSDVKGLKRSMISLLLKDNPGAAAAAKEIIADATLVNGIGSFNAGKYQEAFAIWRQSAETGNEDSIFAMAMAKKSIEARLKDPMLDTASRIELEAVLRTAPDIQENGGFYLIHKGK